MAFVAYLDGSGDGTDPKATVVSVGGYIANESQWAEFERRWSEALALNDVPALHMKDFAHSTGAYKEWKGDEQRRARFLGDMVQIINDCTIQTVSTTILMDAYRQVNDSHALQEAFGGPYPIALWPTVARTVDWHARHGHEEPLMIIIERGDNDQSAFSKTVNALGGWDIDMVTAPVFQKKQWVDVNRVTQYCLPLQAADFYCYETSKMCTDWILKGKTTARQSMFGLSYPPKGARQDRMMMQLTTGTGLLRLVKQFGVMKRFNRPLEIGGRVPLEPLCYVDMDQPIICKANAQPSAKSRRRAMRVERGSGPGASVLRRKAQAMGKRPEPSGQS